MERNRILGMIEVSGSYSVNIVKNSNYNSGYSVNINYIMRSKDASLLLFVQDILSNNDILSDIKEDKLIIKNIENIKRFIDFIGDDLISDKRREQLDRWKKIVELVDCDRHCFPEGIKQIMYQKKMMGKI